jgi:hypothetical protein
MYRITSMFRQQESFRISPHNGIDFKMEIGEPLRSIKSGKIHIHDFGNENVGKMVKIYADDGKEYIYGHLSKFTVKEGQIVNQGDLIGYAGNTGFSTGSHLHFGIKEGGRFIDPSPYIDDIQNMNVKQFVQHIPEPTQLKLNFFDYMKEHMNVLSDLKLHLIHLTDNTLFIQISKQILQFCTGHSSFLNCIITHLF